jgi:hypothetical protein
MSVEACSEYGLAQPKGVRWFKSNFDATGSNIDDDMDIYIAKAPELPFGWGFSWHKDGHWLIVLC